MMRLAPEITLRPYQPAGVNREAVADATELHSDVLLDGRPIGARVSGSQLEAAVQCSAGWLIFSTGDTPDEEMLRISLVGSNGTLLDAARIGGPYSTGAFSNLRFEPPSGVHFRFIDNADWRVEVFDAPQVSLPWWPDAKGVWRGSQLSRYFRVLRTPV